MVDIKDQLIAINDKAGVPRRCIVCGRKTTRINHGTIVGTVLTGYGYIHKKCQTSSYNKLKFFGSSRET